ncbi:MAG: flippase-like domain-containing protein [Abditibacteriales bacterium]|nr:flippase-like domain-containing protein [Abditibacteriales bacterium]MDW8366831.1 lysylphosphatidylglycerol synthase transmembrane domain-containing protein [Abditibacteriales bacterium]
MKSRALHISISAAILALLLWSVDWRQMASGLRHANWWLLLLGCGIVQLGALLRAWRWQLIANKDAKCATFADACVVTYVGSALNILLPASLGDVARAYYGYQRTGRRETMLASSLMDKGLALWAAMGMGLIPAALNGLWHWFGVELGMLLALSAVLFFPRVVPWSIIARCLRCVRVTLRSQELTAGCCLPLPLIVATVGLSVAAWLTNYVQLALTLRALGEPVPFAFVMVAAPLITVAKLTPFTLDGLGTQEAAFVYLLQPAGVSAGAALLSSFALRLGGSYLPALVGALMLGVGTPSHGTRKPSPPKSLERHSVKALEH